MYLICSFLVKGNPGHYCHFLTILYCDFGDGHYIPMAFSSLAAFSITHRPCPSHRPSWFEPTFKVGKLAFLLYLKHMFFTL